MTTQTLSTEDSSLYAFGDLYLDGQWRPGAAPEPIHVKSPWSGEPVARIAAAAASDVALAYSGARRAQQAWAAAIPGARARVFVEAARVMERRKDEIVSWLVREAGSTVMKAGIEWWAVVRPVRFRRGDV